MEAFVRLARAHGDTSVFLDFSEVVLDQVPPFVGVRIELGRKAAVGFRRDNRGDVPFVEVGSQPVGIEGTVGKQVIGGKFLDQFRHRAEVVRLPR